MKVNIKKITLLVIALAAAYYVVPTQALTKKELQSRESAIKDLLSKEDLSEKDKDAFDALVNKLRGTMYAHMVPNYQQLFQAAVILNNAGVVASKSLDGVADKQAIKTALDVAKKSVLEKQAALSGMSTLATGLAILLLDAFKAPDSFSTKGNLNAYKAAYRALMKDTDIVISNNASFKTKGIKEDGVAEGESELSFTSGIINDVLKDKK